MEIYLNIEIIYFLSKIRDKKNISLRFTKLQISQMKTENNLEDYRQRLHSQGH